MTDDDIPAIVAGLSGAHKRVLERLTHRWIRGTGLAHYGVGTDLIAMGLAEQRNGLHRDTRRIRVTDDGVRVRQYLKGEQS